MTAPAEDARRPRRMPTISRHALAKLICGRLAELLGEPATAAWWRDEAFRQLLKEGAQPETVHKTIQAHEGIVESRVADELGGAREWLASLGETPEPTRGGP